MLAHILRIESLESLNSEPLHPRYNPQVIHHFANSLILRPTLAYQSELGLNNVDLLQTYIQVRYRKSHLQIDRYLHYLYQRLGERFVPHQLNLLA